MKLLYFSGFSLKNEKELFSDFLIENDFTISGFSYGAIKAFEYGLESNNRIDKLQLFSPAFFNDKNDKFKRLQMMFFSKDSNEYAKNFLSNCGFDEELSKKYFTLGSSKELNELLYYMWDEKKLQSLKDRGVFIEIYLGGKDSIINPQIACDFFKEFGEVYFIKDASHILKTV
jgi:hypothetical protein